MAEPTVKEIIRKTLIDELGINPLRAQTTANKIYYDMRHFFFVKRKGDVRTWGDYCSDCEGVKDNGSGLVCPFNGETMDYYDTCVFDWENNNME
ncbi:MAG: hypothetical protein ACTSPB_00640 [Candidatus Thorarchaeota archaeon]